MNAALLVLAWLAPLGMLPVAGTAFGRWLTPLAIAPALAAALVVPAGTVVEVPWLLLGAQFGLDASARVFLAFGAVLWLIAGVYAAFYLRRDPHAARFRRFFLLAMSGNFGLIIGQDLMSFYLGFGLMGLAAYGLVVHDGTSTARRAGRVYLVMTLVGELVLLAGFLLLYGRTGTLSPTPEQIAVGVGSLELGLLVTAFGIKAGMIGLHVWLPLAHPAAPVPASAVLSGAMIKTALIGWMRYLPLGVVPLSALGEFLVTAGMASALLAIPLGLGQRDPKVVLAYSSIGKMGTMIAGLGIAAMEPELAPAVVAAVTFYAAHHGLAKGALFLGVGVVKSRAGLWPLLLLALPALVLAGAPFTSGGLAKSLFKEAIASAPTVPGTLLRWMLPVTAAGTLLLMARFVYLMFRAAGSAPPKGNGLTLSWAALVSLSLALPLVHGGAGFEPMDMGLILAVAAGAWIVAINPPAGLVKCVGRVPPGDIIGPLLAVAAGLRPPEWVMARGGAVRRGAGGGDRGAERLAALSRNLQGAETALAGPALAGAVWLGVMTAIFLGVALWG